MARMAHRSARIRDRKLGTGMSDREALWSALEAVTDWDDRLIVVHSSMIHLRLDAACLKYTCQSVLSTLLARGHTLALPAFTLGFCRGQPFDWQAPASETGQLAEWLRELPGAARTPHPIYSFVVAGPLSAEIAASANSTTFGDDSCFALFERYAARIVMLGCGWRSCTQFHHYEEEVQVLYRTFKTFSGTGTFEAGAPRALHARMFVRDFDLVPPAVNDFSDIEADLRAAAAIRTETLGAGKVESVRCRDLAAACRKRLADDKLALVRDRDALGRRLAARGDPSRCLEVAVLGSANLKLLGDALRTRIAELMPDHFARVQVSPYGQLAREILDPQSALNSRMPSYVFLAERLEDILHESLLDHGLPEPEALKRVDEYLGLVSRLLEAPRTLVVMHRFAQLKPEASPDLSRLFAACNARLEEFARQHREVHILDPMQVAVRSGQRVHDPRGWHLGRLPYSLPFTRALAESYAGLLLSRVGASARLVVVDLDNTLWGGVVGEDGVAGLKIGGDYPGNAYLAMQQALKRLAARGIALAIASKNDRDLVERAFAERPEMALQLRDFAAVRINWDPKWQNVREIAQELGLGLENVLFMDDNPVEREHMRQLLPEVRVLELPGDPAWYADALLANPYLSALKITDEDRKRAAGYRARAAVESERRRYDRIEDFYASLQIKLHLVPLSDDNISRAEQLASKTNQFNTTTRRYGARDLEALQRSGAEVRVIAAEDRFTPKENIGLLVVRWDEPEKQSATIDSLLLSCRVLGRGIESGVLGWARRAAAERGMRRLLGPIVATERNGPVRRVYAEHGFVDAGGGAMWVADLSGEAANLLAWLTIVDQD